ncbi:MULTISPECIES: hypothetical protein [unclassified Bacillus (in: firmicutes)]|uniref:hypothetical protein n=1 Tax=unclassified Bacillus (in: firmicutes) TaxID=185979 RepID=UPI00232B0021|nr:hypothetical protein [Bacillus sp. BP-3]MDC2866330.1 hypothetical protein [Bacillus sp. BP-3]
MDKKEIAKDLTIAYLQNKPNLVKSVDDAILIYEKMYDAINRSSSVVNYTQITPEDFIRNNK